MSYFIQTFNTSLMFFEAGGQLKIISTNYKPCPDTSGIVVLET